MKPPGLYTEFSIQRALARKTFAGALMCIDNCNRLGSECDLLVVDKSLRCIDVEIKCSVPDLKADRSKDKWFEAQSWARRHEPKVTLHWPKSVWKHYYIVAAPAWRDELVEHCGSVSGILVITLDQYGNQTSLVTKRKAIANPNQQPASIELIRDLARLTSYRLWNARAQLHDRQVQAEVAA